MKVVDARGLSCPQPVIQARKAIDAGEFPIQVLVDTATAQENVRRMASKTGCQVTVEVKGNEAELIITRRRTTDPQIPSDIDPAKCDTYNGA